MGIMASIRSKVSCVVYKEEEEGYSVYSSLIVYRLCHHGVVRSLSWRHPSSAAEETNVLQLASGGEDHSVRIFNVEY